MGDAQDEETRGLLCVESGDTFRSDWMIGTAKLKYCEMIAMTT